MTSLSGARSQALSEAFIILKQASERETLKRLVMVAIMKVGNINDLKFKLNVSSYLFDIARVTGGMQE